PKKYLYLCAATSDADSWEPLYEEDCVLLGEFLIGLATARIQKIKDKLAGIEIIDAPLKVVASGLEECLSKQQEDFVRGYLSADRDSKQQVRVFPLGTRVSEFNK